MSTTTELTPWFPKRVKPVRQGVYQTSPPNCIAAYQHWNGKFWGLATNNPKRAFQFQHNKSAWQNDSWRGLAADPEAKP